MARTKLEKDFEKDFMDEVNARFPGGHWVKGNSQMQQGIPDRVFYHGRNWAMFETKRARNSVDQVNQDWHIEKFNDMSFAARVTPENYHEVLDEMEQAFGDRR